MEQRGDFFKLRQNPLWLDRSVPLLHRGTRRLKASQGQRPSLRQVLTAQTSAEREARSARDVRVATEPEKAGPAAGRARTSATRIRSKILEGTARTPAHLHRCQPVGAVRTRGPPEPSQALEKLGFFFPERTMRPVNSIVLQSYPGSEPLGGKSRERRS